MDRDITYDFHAENLSEDRYIIMFIKNFNWSLFFGCCVISIGIAVAGWFISSNLPETAEIPNRLGVYMENNLSYAQSTFPEYLSVMEVSEFLGMPIDQLSYRINNSELDGTFTIIGGRQIFSREKLVQWINDRIENK